MIEITVQDMINSVDVLKGIAEKTMPAKTAYKFARISKEIERENNIFQETRRDLVMKYGEKDENGELKEEDGNIIIPKDKIEIFQKEADELINTHITINAEKISLDDLNGNIFTPLDMIKIEWLIEE